MTIAPDFWPAPIAHLAGPYVGLEDESIVVAEISDASVNGFRGMRQLYTALVPLSDVDEALHAIGGIGWKVECWGPHPIVPSEGGWDGRFWINGPGNRETRYEALVQGWPNHNRTVMVPDNSFLMCYGMVPRVLNNGRVIWDDPGKPVYGVVDVKPVSLYEVPNRHSSAGVRVLRDYLEDYASLKRCAAVAVFFEERFSCRDAEVDGALGQSEGVNLDLPGRRLSLKRIEPSHFGGADQLVQIWGCRLILRPAGRPVSDEAEPLLLWPDLPGPITPEQARGLGLLECVYVRDEALSEWEGREEFNIHPPSGHVSYNGRWSTADVRRHGRHHIALSLCKLYEGVPWYVTKHFHRFAAARSDVERDRQRYGDRNIGQRAEEVLGCFLDLTKALAEAAAQLDMLFGEDDFSGLTAERVQSHGWWTMAEFRNLGCVVPIGLSQDSFLERCVQLFQVIERFRPGPLKQILRQLGFSQGDFQSLGSTGSLRLLGTICQLSELAEQTGLGLLSDFSSLRASWDRRRLLAVMSPLFALLELRNLHSHGQGTDRQKKLAQALRVFDLETTSMMSGWGLALDRVYDEVTASLRGVRHLISAACH